MSTKSDPEIVADVRERCDKADSLFLVGEVRALLRVIDEQWRPIATAPTNESVLVYIPNAEHYGEGIYRAIQVDMGTGRRWMSTAWACGRDLGSNVKPTHWQPLPTPPRAEAEAEGGPR